MQLKRIFSGITAVLIAVTLTACGKTEPTAAEATTTAAATTAAVTAAATTTTAAAATTNTETEAVPADDAIFPVLAFQDYTDLAMIEYIELSADFQTYTPAMVELNDAVYEEVGNRINRYEELLEESENNTKNYIGGINIWGYSISDENYIQIYHTILEYPTYGTEGDLFGFVYDIAEDDYVTLDEFMETVGTTADELSDEITEIFASTNPTDTVNSVNIKTFNLMLSPDGEYSYGFMFEMETTAEKAEESWKRFYMYTPFDGEVWEMNSEQLFDPYSVDQYDPPLHCNEGWMDYYNSLSSVGDDGQGDVIPDSETFGILQGDYYRERDMAAAHFTFYGTENVDAYYASGSYETSYTLKALPDKEMTDDSGDTYNEVSFEMYNADGELEFIIVMADAAPGSFVLNDKDGYFVAEYVNINV
jgi:hypothetical protein